MGLIGGTNKAYGYRSKEKRPEFLTACIKQRGKTMIFADVKQGDKVISNAFGSGVVEACFPHARFSVVFNRGNYTLELSYLYDGRLANHNGSRDLWYDDNGERSDVKPHVWSDSDIGTKAMCSDNHLEAGWGYCWYYQGFFRGLHWFSARKDDFNALYAFKQSKKDI